MFRSTICKLLLGIAASATFTPVPSPAQNFKSHFENKTLRVDYIFEGSDKEQSIAVDELAVIDGWAGRVTNLDSIPLHGNGIITMSDAKTGKAIYKTSFSTLFQEWQGTEEATRIRKAFENVFLLPMPKDSADVNVSLYDFKGRTSVSFTHRVRPNDILIRPLRPSELPPHRYLKKSALPDAIDIAILAEGYTAAEAEDFYAHAQTAVEELFSYSPFKEYAGCFNVVAVALPSAESGVSVPSQRQWKKTALSSHFDTFYSSRYLTTLRLRQMHDALTGIPYEHIIILANTDNYGGGGIYNSYTLTTARHAAFAPVVVHEFGHSFAGLADEYYYDDQYTQFYYKDTEPWEQNITTLKDFHSKWEDMLPKNTPIPTKADAKHPERIGVYEGAGYQSKGVYRAFLDCRMKTNEAKAFCAVCQRAIKRLIQFYVEDADRNRIQ